MNAHLRQVRNRNRNLIRRNGCELSEQQTRLFEDAKNLIEEAKISYIINNEDTFTTDPKSFWRWFHHLRSSKIIISREKMASLLTRSFWSRNSPIYSPDSMMSMIQTATHLLIPMFL